MAAKKNQLSEMLTLTQAAKLLGLARQTIWDAVKRGRIKARKIGHVSLVSRSSVERYRTTRKRTGRPPKKSK